MMHTLELVQQILREMWARKLRSVLALFGIIWGTISVVIMLALGQGFYTATKQSMINIADNTLIIYPGGTASKSFKGQKSGRTVNINIQDTLQIAHAISEIKLLSPIIRNYEARISWRKQFQRKTITGVSDAYALLRVFNAVPGGRFINQNDINERRKVVFLGDKFQQTFFGSNNPLGKQLLINGIPFEIIGSRQPKDQTQNIYDRDETSIFIPYSTFTSLWGNKNVESILLLPESTAHTSIIKRNLQQYLSHRLQYDPQDQNAVNIIDLSEGMQFFNNFFLGIEIFLGFCGLMTLAVGGVGVANIMFLIVTERTAEIGLRMALGAKPKHILYQTLLEACLIVALGGLIGLVTSVFLVHVISFLPLPDWLGKPSIIPATVYITLLVLAVIGLLAGIFPARRAAQMQPIMALSF